MWTEQLQFVDYFAPPNANWLFRRDLDLNVSPMAFDYRGRKFLVATSKECKLWLLDRTTLGVRTIACTSTSNGCGGVANGVWAITLDPKNKTVSSWKTNGGSPVGNLAFTAGGRILVAVGPGTTTAGGYANAIVALDAQTLQPLDWFTSPSAAFVTTPVVINHGGREIVAVAARDAIFLLDAASLGGANHSTPLYVMQTDKSEPDALATFEPPAGIPWLLAPGQRGIVAFRIVDEGGKTSLQRGWVSPDLVAPTAPIVVNDVVFAASSGRPQGSAVLYAFDSRSGRELWNSGQTITSYVPPGNLWASNSQVHVGTYDGTVYAFGYALERRRSKHFISTPRRNGAKNFLS